MVGFWPYPQTLDYTVKLVWDKHSSLLQKFVKYEQKKFYYIGPWSKFSTLDVDAKGLELGPSFQL
jgi:hypothetical protein